MHSSGLAMLTLLASSALSGCLTIHEGTAQGLALQATYGVHWNATTAKDAISLLHWNVTKLDESGLDASLQDRHPVLVRATEFGFTLQITYAFAAPDIIRRENVTEANAEALAREPQYAPDFATHLTDFENSTGWMHQGDPRASCICTQP